VLYQPSSPAYQPHDTHLQAALKKLANQRIGSRLLTVPAHQLPSARVGAASGAAAPNLHRAVSGASLRSTASTAGVLNGSGARGRWRRYSI